MSVRVAAAWSLLCVCVRAKLVKGRGQGLLCLCQPVSHFREVVWYYVVLFLWQGVSLVHLFAIGPGTSGVCERRGLVVREWFGPVVLAVGASPLVPSSCVLHGAAGRQR